MIKMHEMPGMGAAVSGFNPNRRGDIDSIKESIYRHKIVILKDQALNEQEFCELSCRLGTAEPYLQDNYHHPDYPLIFVSSNVTKDGKQMGVARTGGYWHSDTSFMSKPVAFTLLYPQIIPEQSARTTLFIDMQKAYEAMPLEMRNRLASLNFVHSGKWRYKVRKDDVGLDLGEILQMIHKVQPPVIHPAVITHPVTRARMLYASRGFTVGVEGMETDEGAELLSEVFDFMERPEFVHEFQWSLGDIILWDNRCFTHKAGRLAAANDPVNGDRCAEEETLVYRIIVRDGYPLCAAGSSVTD